MAQELRTKPYYDSIINSGDHLNTNVACKLGCEFFLSNLLFKGDLSRVLYSKEDICFRRRVEMLGSGHVKEDKFDVLGLDLPFAIYSQTGSYEPDDRGSTQSASQIVAGYMHPDTGIVLRGAAVKIKYSFVAFFGRRDDVNIASQLIYWEQQPKFPLYYIVNHTLCGYPLDIPVFITVETIDSNTEYAEKDWLSKSKIFPIKVDLTVRSYQTLIESAGGDIELPLRFSGLYATNANQGEIVLTQNSLMVWGDSKFTPTARPKLYTKFIGFDDRNPLIRDNNPFKFEDYTEKINPDQVRIFQGMDVEQVTVEQLADSQAVTIQAAAIKGYFEEDRDIVLEEFYQVDEGTTEREIMIQWSYDERCAQNFGSIILYIPGIYNIEIKEFSKDQFVFEGLYPGSKYDLTIITKSSRGIATTYKLDLKTKGTPVLGGKLSDNLVGRRFTAL